jgi:hypothetical protein
MVRVHANGEGTVKNADEERAGDGRQQQHRKAAQHASYGAGRQAG